MRPLALAIVVALIVLAVPAAALAAPGGDDWAADIAVAGGLVFVAGSQARDHGGVVDCDFLTLAIQR